MNDFDNEILPTDPDEGEEITERVAGRETYEWVRSLVGAVLVITLLFTFVVRLMGVAGVHDTQCGFKLFRMDVMRSIFEAQRIERFSFDVELIRRVCRAGGVVKEIPVVWHGGKRSSLRVCRDAPRMLFDLLRILRDRASSPDRTRAGR